MMTWSSQQFVAVYIMTSGRRTMVIAPVRIYISPPRPSESLSTQERTMRERIGKFVGIAENRLSPKEQR